MMKLAFENLVAGDVQHSIAGGDVPYIGYCDLWVYFESKPPDLFRSEPLLLFVGSLLHLVNEIHLLSSAPATILVPKPDAIGSYVMNFDRNTVTIRDELSEELLESSSVSDLESEIIEFCKAYCAALILVTNDEMAKIIRQVLQLDEVPVDLIDTIVPIE